MSELQGIYDETRCFFLQWLLGKEIKELVNSARISAVQSGKTFTWAHARAETLKSMTDLTLTARFLALSRLKRTQGTTAKLWISQVLTRKALLEDPKLPAPILLPECLYLEILVGQMSAQETTVFDHCPSIGDNLLQKTIMGQTKFTLDKLKRSIDACSNPPYFRGVSTPITDLLDSAEPKVPKQKRDQTKDKEGKTKDPERQQSYDHVRNLLLDGIHLAPPTISYLSTAVATRPTMASPTGFINLATYPVVHSFLSPPTLPPLFVWPTATPSTLSPTPTPRG